MQPEQPPQTNPTQTPSPPVPVSTMVAATVASIDDELQAANLPKKLSRGRQLKGVVFGIAVLIVGAVLSGYLYISQGQATVALLTMAFATTLGLLAVGISLVSYRQLTKSENNPKPYNQFQTSTATNYKVPLDKAVLSPGESIGNWLGPVNRQGAAGASFQVLSAETDNQAENTLLFTATQVIGLMASPDDLPSSAQTGTLSGLANAAVKYSEETGVEKAVQFAALNAKHWSDIVAKLSEQPLDTILQSHLNFGLPYNKIQTIEVKKSFVNSGLIFHLSDGSSLSYSTLQKERLPEVASYLKQYVTTQ
jgi:hypothetical protein